MTTDNNTTIAPDTIAPETIAPETFITCRVWEQVNRKYSVLDVLEGMVEWYNGYDFLWSHGGWRSQVVIPNEYLETFRVGEERREVMRKAGHELLNDHVVVAACLMQAVRWFTNYDPDHRKDDPDDMKLYLATASVLAAALGCEAYPDDGKNWEPQIIRYNDMVGRTFAGIMDLLNSAVRLARYSYDFNVNILNAQDRASKDAQLLKDLEPERDGMGNRTDGEGELNQ